MPCAQPDQYAKHDGKGLKSVTCAWTDIYPTTTQEADAGHGTAICELIECETEKRKMAGGVPHFDTTNGLGALSLGVSGDAYAFTAPLVRELGLAPVKCIRRADDRAGYSITACTGLLHPVFGCGLMDVCYQSGEAQRTGKPADGVAFVPRHSRTEYEPWLLPSLSCSTFCS